MQIRDHSRRLRPDELLDRVPDTPRCVETRALLRAGTCDVFGTPAGFVARSRVVPLGGVVGTPPAEALASVLSDVAPTFELLVHEERDLAHVRTVLPDWIVEPATVHTPASGPGDPDPRLDIRISDPPDAPSVYALPETWRLWAAASAALSCVWVGGHPVAVCEAIAVTERYWEVGISTLESHRRRGYARAAFQSLARHMESRALTPVWGALDGNIASRTLARSLGFHPVDHLWLLRPPGR